MAVERQKIKSYTLQQFIANQVESFIRSRKRIRDLKDAEFQRRVFENGLSFSDQKQYYQQLLSEEQSKDVVDTDYVEEIKNKITRLNSLIEAENFANEYRASFEALKTAQANIDDHINFLNDRLSVVKNQELRTRIQDLLSEAKQSRETINNNALLNRIKFAENDKRPEILQKALQEVRDKYNQSLAIGDSETASMWNLHIQSLNSQLKQVEIEQKVNEFEVKGLNGKFDAISTLEHLSNMFNNADDSNAINIGGKVYKSEKDFWDKKINNYLQNNFFSILQDEIITDIDVNAKKLTPVLENKFDNKIVQLEALRNNEFIKPYLDKLDNVLTNVSAYGVEKIGAKIVNDYKKGLLGKTTAKNISNAIEKLSNLNKWYNVDVNSSIQEIIKDVASTKSSIVKNQLKVYYDAIKDGSSPADAWKIAENSVAQIDIPDVDLASMKPIDVAKETVSSLDKPSKYDIADTTINTPLTQTSQPDFKPVSTPQTEPPVMQNKAPVIQKGEYIPHPELLSLLKPEQVVTENGKKYLAAGVTAPYRKISSPDELKNYTESQLIRPKDSNDIYLKL